MCGGELKGVRGGEGGGSSRWPMLTPAGMGVHDGDWRTYPAVPFYGVLHSKDEVQHGAPPMGSQGRACIRPGLGSG